MNIIVCMWVCEDEDFESKIDRISDRKRHESVQILRELQKVTSRNSVQILRKYHAVVTCNDLKGVITSSVL